MPHLTIDYSRNLSDKADIPGLCRSLHAAILASGLFEFGAVRVRAIAADHAVVADDLPENAYLDMVFRIGEGRSLEQKKRAGDMIYAAAERHLAPLFATPHFALSFEIREIDGGLSWKTNAIHPRLRGQ
jgi:5-carboxymethyl-2-hydroxymuconate isomerase